MVWSFPPINGDFPFLILLINTVVVSVIGTMNDKIKLSHWVLFRKDVFSVGFLEKKRILNPAKLTPKNWLPVSPINIFEGYLLNRRKLNRIPSNPIIINVNTVIEDCIKIFMAIKCIQMLIEIRVVIPSILSSIFNEFIKPTTQSAVMR